MKKSCDGCKALNEIGLSGIEYCLLGHPLKVIYRQGYEFPAPTEQCEKPKNFNDFLKARDKKLSK